MLNAECRVLKVVECPPQAGVVPRQLLPFIIKHATDVSINAAHEEHSPEHPASLPSPHPRHSRAPSTTTPSFPISSSLHSPHLLLLPPHTPPLTLVLVLLLALLRLRHSTVPVVPTGTGGIGVGLFVDPLRRPPSGLCRDVERGDGVAGREV